LALVGVSGYGARSFAARFLSVQKAGRPPCSLEALLGSWGRGSIGESLVAMQLISNRDEDGMHPRDLIGVGLIDRSWLPKLPPDLAERLTQILDTPDA
jgi:hypothetical protein